MRRLDFLHFSGHYLPVKQIISATLVALLLPSCGLFNKKEVGPYGDNRSSWEKIRDYEKDHADDWSDKMMHREEYRRRKNSAVDKMNP
jgi:hypothetical protein